MKAPRQLLVLAAALAMGGCATLLPSHPPEQNARLRLDQGLAALDAGLYTEAFTDLAWVYSHCPGREAGSRALIALAALELDPRNDLARPSVGTELLARMIQTSHAPDWVRPLTKSSYLMALALGAPPPGEPRDETHPEDQEPAPVPAGAEEPVPAGAQEPEDHDEHGMAGLSVPEAPSRAEAAYGCGREVTAEQWAAPSLPTLPGPSMARLLSEAESRRASASERADSLAARLVMLTEQLEATRAELERIRKTLKP